MSTHTYFISTTMLTINKYMIVEQPLKLRIQPFMGKIGEDIFSKILI